MKTDMIAYYTYRVAWSNEEQEYVGLCAEFPSLSHGDELPENAMVGILRLVDSVVKDLQSSGEVNLPKPSEVIKFRSIK